jgi:serine acetyltransferase
MKAKKNDVLSIMALMVFAMCIGACASGSIKTTSAGRELVIPEGTTAIRDRQYQNRKLTGILVIPESVKTIGKEAFMGNQLSGLVVPKDVTIGERAFAFNPLTSLTIGEGVTIGREAFHHNQLDSLVIPSGVKIGSWAFSANQLTSVTIAENVTIGYEAFKANIIRNLTIGKGATINESAFAYSWMDTTFSFYNLSITIEGPFRGPLTVFDDGGRVGLAVLSGNYPGKYIQERDTWFFNGEPLPPPAELIMADGIVCVSIDGASAENFFLPGNRYRVEKVYIVPPGMHSVEVNYYKRKGNTATYSEGSVTFEHRYLFERKAYVFTGTPEGNQIRFGIEPQ